MTQTKTMTLCDGIEVTFRRRTWAEVRDAIKFTRLFLSELEARKAQLAPELYAMELSTIQMDVREKALADVVQNWDGVRDRLSVGGFMELEKAVDSFSKDEAVAGN